MAATIALALSGCATENPAETTTPAPEPSASDTLSQEPTAAALTESSTLTVITYDSFAISDEAKARFEAETGYTVEYIAPGNAGTVLNQLILTKDSPLGDVVYGIDNTFAGRAIEEGVLTPYETTAISDDVKEKYSFGAWVISSINPNGQLTPIDYGDVCLNADDAWFAEKGLAIPAGWDDLAKSEYKDTLVVENAASSSPGLAFLLATIGAKGADGYLDYWKSLKDNGLKVAADWTEAYTVDFSGSSGEGAYPLVVSYNTSPASEVGDDGKARTSVLEWSCFRQIEYAGVINGAQNEVGARKWIDFMLSPEVQAEIPAQMWTYPVLPDVAVPEDWAQYAPVIASPAAVDAVALAQNREIWIKEWTDNVVG
ncbi:MAG: thiamine ABC transporter substrate-binding protein [Propionibacteriaceae bacterium]|nr:thiamine ABC transporter substrate-binding protein [Propionibacteriaceae bacterium]